MTTTVNVSQKGQMELPEEFCRRKRIKPGTALRVTEVGDGLYVAPVPEPTEKELKEVIAVAGSLTPVSDSGRADGRERDCRISQPEAAKNGMNVVADTNVVISAIF